MKNRKLTLALWGLIFTASMPCIAQVNGGRGPMYVRSAWVLDPGHFTVYGHTRTFGKVSNVDVSNVSAVTYWDVQGSLNFNYGLSRRFELGFTPIVYQDNNRGGKGYNFLDDLFLRLKIGSLGSKGSTLSYGLELGTRFPTAAKHNLVFEPYAAGKVGFGATGIVSYARDPFYPDLGLNLHFNLGYWNHNDVGEKLSDRDPSVDSVRVTSMTQELLYGVAWVLPSDRIDLRLELSGNVFIQKPPVTAYSRENVAYISPGIAYKPYRWMSLDCSLDLRVAGGKDETLYGANSVGQIPDLPNYASWRLNLGMKVTVLPTSLYAFSERDILLKKAESRRELFEQIIKEQRETESAEAELERIKEERRKAERELVRLQQILEGEAKQHQQDEAESDSHNGHDNQREETPPQY